MPGTISALADLPKNVRAISEAAGKINYGKERKCTSISKDLVCAIITIWHSLCISCSCDASQPIVEANQLEEFQGISQIRQTGDLGSSWVYHQTIP